MLLLFPSILQAFQSITNSHQILNSIKQCL
jgi:hypothetical protein